MIYEGTLEENKPEAVLMRINIKGRFKKIEILKKDIKLIRLAVKI